MHIDRYDHISPVPTTVTSIHNPCVPLPRRYTALTNTPTQRYIIQTLYLQRQTNPRVLCPHTRVCKSIPMHREIHKLHLHNTYSHTNTCTGFFTCENTQTHLHRHKTRTNKHRHKHPLMQKLAQAHPHFVHKETHTHMHARAVLQSACPASFRGERWGRRICPGLEGVW
jgi:hypothetical protein